jgi:putative aldouronate transport system permease protein
VSKRAIELFDIVNTALMILVLLCMIYPLYFTIIASISEPSEVALGRVFLVPRGFTLEAYENVFRKDEIWVGYRNTIIYTTVGTALNLALTIPCAFALSRQNLRGRTAITWYFLFTMFFSGGLIPLYLVVRGLGLVNKPYTLIILSGFAVFYMVVSRIFFETTIPEELYESARIDGCTDFGQFFRIALPLSKAIVAVMTLFYAVGRWNDFFAALVFISDINFYPLQLVLRNILIEGRMALSSLMMRNLSTDEMLAITKRAYLAEAMKYSLIFIAAAPLLVAYPFVQKYFVKGVLIGSLKG